MKVLNIEKIKTLKEIEHFIIPGNPGRSFQDVELHSKTYLYWKEFWNGIFRANKTTDTASANDFLRYFFISGLRYREEIVGLITSSLFDLRFPASREHSYFSPFTKEFFFELEKRNIYQVMSVESLSVRREWRGKDLEVPFAAILIGLNAMKLASFIPVDALIAPIRTDNGAFHYAQQMGYESLVDEVTHHNTPCSLICLEKNKIPSSFPNPDINHFINYYWDNRRDLTELTIKNKTKEVDIKQSAA